MIKKILFVCFVFPFSLCKKCWCSDDSLERIVAILLSSLLALLYSCVLFGAFYVFNIIGVGGEFGEGEVIEKRISKASTALVSNGKTTTPIHKPTTYHITFNIEGGTDSISVSKDVFDSIIKGDVKKLEYGFTNFTRKLHIKKIRK